MLWLWLEASELRQTVDGLLRHFGSLITSMNTLFRSISGGVTWEDPAESLLHVGAEWTFLFTFYVAFCCSLEIWRLGILFFEYHFTHVSLRILQSWVKVVKLYS